MDARNNNRQLEKGETEMAFNLQDYEPVENRLAEFWSLYPEGRVATELVYHDETRFIVRAEIYRNAFDEKPTATGYAEERVDPNPKRVNFASALENCETSSLGRALANFTFATKGKRPSREEMEKVARMTERPTVINPALEDLKLRLAGYSSDGSVRKAIVTSAVTREIGSLMELTDEEIKAVESALKERLAGEAPFTD